MIWGKGKSGKATGDKAAGDAAPNNAAPTAAAKSSAPPVHDMPSSPPGADQGQADKRASFLAMAERAQKSQFAQLFAQAVAVLMRDQTYRNMPLKDLEFLLVPAVASGQCVIAHAKVGEKGPSIPVALALWASVSPEVEKILGENLDKPLQLKPNQWKSGDQTWLITLAGEPKVMGGFMKQLLEKDLKGKRVKMRTIDKDGKREVKVLQG